MGHGAPQKAYVYDFTLYIFNTNHTALRMMYLGFVGIVFLCMYCFCSIYHEYLDVHIYIYIYLFLERK